jgi:flavin-dependent dehydrogenase
MYDALIVGGGPAGTSAAIHLAQGGARVLLAEQKRFPRAKLCGEFISPECLDHFARLGVEEQMMRAGGAEIEETIFYSRSGSGVSVPSLWFGSGRRVALGLSRAEMDARLLGRASAAGVEVREEAQAVGLLTDGAQVRGVRLKAGGRLIELSARVTIDATGRARALARYLGKNEEKRRRAGKRPAPLVAFKAHLDHQDGAPGRCEIYFYPGGYGGLSQVENGLSNLCFIAPAAEVRACRGDAERVMRSLLSKNRRAAETLRRARVCSEWLAIALEGFGRREIMPAPGMLAVGDAASFIDPFTGSGMLMALESGELAAGAVARYLSKQGDGRSQADAVSLLDGLAADYRAVYEERFSARLRVCAMMRRAAFVPRLAETLIFALNASRGLRRGLARSTRGRKGGANGK